MNTGLIIGIVICCLLLTIGAGVAIYFTVLKSKTVDTTVAQASTDKAKADANLASAQSQLAQAQTDAQKTAAQAAIDKANSDAQISQLALDKANAMSLITQLQSTITTTTSKTTALNAGNRLGLGQIIYSQNGTYLLAMQTDGKLVVYNNGNPLWQSGTLGLNQGLLLTTQGNLVIYGNDGITVQWQSNTVGTGTTLTIDDTTGNLLLKDSTGKLVWSNSFNATITGCENDDKTITCPTGMVIASGTFTFGHWDNSCSASSVTVKKTYPLLNGIGLNSYTLKSILSECGNDDPLPNVLKQFSLNYTYATTVASTNPSKSTTTTITATTTGGTVTVIPRTYNIYKNVDYSGQGDLDAGAMSLDAAKTRCDALETCNGFYFNSTNAYFKHIGEGQGNPSFNAGGDYYYTGLPPVALNTTVLNAGYPLTPGQSMSSPNGNFQLSMQTDGNLVVYNNGNVVWHAIGTTPGNQGLLLTIQGSVQWQSNSSGTGTTLTIDDTTGNLLLKDSTGKLVWTNGCQQVPLYRLYNPANFRHMESTSANESGLSGAIVATICSNNISGTVPLYRAYYSGDTTFHLSSVSLTEITNAGYVLDGTLGYVYPTQVTGTVPVYRRYNSSIKDHMLTKDQTEGGAGYVTDNNAPLFYSF
jgi:hypothetical protein